MKFFLYARFIAYSDGTFLYYPKSRILFHFNKDLKAKYFIKGEKEEEKKGTPFLQFALAL